MNQGQKFNIQQTYPGQTQIYTSSQLPFPIVYQPYPQSISPQRLPIQNQYQHSLPAFYVSPMVNIKKEPEKELPRMEDPKKLPKPPGISEFATMTKPERSKKSSKKNTEMYTCSKCERTYMSYPALYTHTKTKHPTTDNPKLSSRGRPRKTVLRRIKHSH